MASTIDPAATAVVHPTRELALASLTAGPAAVTPMDARLDAEQLAQDLVRSKAGGHSVSMGRIAGLPVIVVRVSRVELTVPATGERGTSVVAHRGPLLSLAR